MEAVTIIPLDRLPVPSGFELPAVLLALVPLVCLLVLGYVVARLVRIGPRPWGVCVFLLLALAGAALQFTESWWQYSLPVLIVATAATIGSAIEVLARPSIRRHVPTVVAVAVVDAGAYVYLAAVLSAYS